MSNIEKRAKKSEYLREFEKYGTLEFGEPAQELVLPLDDFFEWADSGSIGYNLSIAEPYVEHFHQTFQQIRDLDDVENIFVRIMDTNVDSEDDWFSSDTVYVIGSLPKDRLWEIMKATEPNISPDDIYEEWFNGVPANVSSEILEQKVLAMWWD